MDTQKDLKLSTSLGALSSYSDVGHCIIIKKLLDSILSVQQEPKFALRELKHLGFSCKVPTKGMM
jgi:hypothetical protein